VRIIASYVGDSRVSLEHELSGERIGTDLPVDNGGKGRTFSPTDLLVSALSSCILTIMAKLAEREGADLKGAELEFEKEMGTSPRRIARISGVLTLPASVPEALRPKLQACIQACPVHKSLHPDVQVAIETRYR